MDARFLKKLTLSTSLRASSEPTLIPRFQRRGLTMSNLSALWGGFLILWIFGIGQPSYSQPICTGVTYFLLIGGRRPVGRALSSLEPSIALQLREDDLLQEMPAAKENLILFTQSNFIGYRNAPFVFFRHECFQIPRRFIINDKSLQFFDLCL